MRFLKTVPLLSLALLAAYTAPATAQTAGPFAPDTGCETNGRVWSVEFQNKVMYIGGDFTHVRPFGADKGGPEEVPRNHVAACSAETGQLLPWNPNVNGTVYSILPQGDKVYLGGSFSMVGSVARSKLAAVSAADGSVLGATPAVNNTVRAIEKGPNNNIFIGGHFSKVGAYARAKIAQFNPVNGSVIGWAPKIQQKSTTLSCPPRCLPKVYTIAFGQYTDPSTKALVSGVYFGGHFGLVNGVDREQAAAVDIVNGTKVLRFNPWIYNDVNCPTCNQVETHRVYKMIVHNSKMYMCGGFWVTYSKPNKTNPNAPRGLRQNSFNILVTDLYKGWKDPIFGAGNDGDTPDCEIHEDVFYLGGHFGYAGKVCSQNPPPGTSTRKCTGSNSTYRLHVEAVRVSDGRLLCWDPQESSPHGPWSVGHATDQDVLAFGGEFLRFGGVYNEGVARYTDGDGTNTQANSGCLSAKA